MPTERDEQLLGDLLDGRLSDAEAEALRARMAAEPALKEAYDELERVGTFARAFDAAVTLEPPEDFLAQVRARIAAEPPARAEAPEVAPAPRGGRLLQFMAYGYAAAAVLVLAVTGFWMFGQQEPAPETHDMAKKGMRETLEKDDAAGSVEEDEDAIKEARDPEVLESLTPKQPGLFQGPGGAVSPRLRTAPDGMAADAEAPVEDAPDSKSRGSRPVRNRRGDGRPAAAPVAAPAPSKIAREQWAVAEPVTYVLEVEDVDAARAELQVLLASLDEKGDADKGDADTSNRDEIQARTRLYKIAFDDPFLARLAEVPETAESESAKPMAPGDDADEPAAADDEGAPARRALAELVHVATVEKLLTRDAAERLASFASTEPFDRRVTSDFTAKSEPVADAPPPLAEGAPAPPSAALPAPGAPAPTTPAAGGPTAEGDAKHKKADPRAVRKAESKTSGARADGVPIRVILVRKR